jgi:hypothetical protein
MAIPSESNRLSIKARPDIDFPYALLVAVAQRRAANFSGLGLIFYENLAELPHMQLTGPDDRPISLPIHGMEPIAEILSSISATSSPWHDGFHLIDIENGSLTHLSQFISPPMIPRSDTAEIKLPLGARQAAALLSSLISGVACAGLISVTGDVTIYRNGRSKNP